MSPYYDAMVAKLIAHGRDREDAIRRLRAALADAPLLGLRNNARFLGDLLDHDAFRSALMTTIVIDAWFEHDEPIAQRPQPPTEAWCLAAALLAHGSGWRADSVAAYDIELACDGAPPQRLRVDTTARDGTIAVTPAGQAHVGEPHAGQAHAVGVLAWHDRHVRYRFDGVERRAVALHVGRDVHLALGADSFVFAEPSAFAAADAGIDASRLRAPVAGVLAQLLAQPGDVLAAGQPVACVEAMKMEMWLAAPFAARVVAVHARAGDQMASGAVIAELEPIQEST